MGSRKRSVQIHTPPQRAGFALFKVSSRLQKEPSEYPSCQAKKMAKLTAAAATSASVPPKILVH